jgi:hypothetical protein
MIFVDSFAGLVMRTLCTCLTLSLTRISPLAFGIRAESVTRFVDHTLSATHLQTYLHSISLLVALFTPFVAFLMPDFCFSRSYSSGLTASGLKIPAEIFEYIYKQHPTPKIYCTQTLRSDGNRRRFPASLVCICLYLGSGFPDSAMSGVWRGYYVYLTPTPE